MKTKYKITNIIMAIILLFNIIPLNFVENIFAATHTSVLQSSAIEKVAAGTETDGTYSFSLRATDNTRCEIWGYTGKVISYFENSTYHHTMILPQDDNLSGKIGCWFYNVGQYHGKTVDVKCTYIWDPLILNGQRISPLIDATWTTTKSGNNSNVIAFHFANKSYEIKYELYSEGKPLTVNMSLTFQDIDWCQAYGFKMGTGTINKMQCRTDATSYYKYYDGRYWFYSGDTYSQDTPESSIRLEMKNTNCFYIVYCTNNDYWSYPLGKIFYQTEAEAKTNFINSESSLKSAFNSGFSEVRALGLGWGFCTAESYGPYTLPTPVKYVSDTNETLVTTNNVNETETFAYSIYQQIPQENSSYYYSGFKMVDVLPRAVTYQSAAVYNEQNQNVSSLFTITQSNGTVTFQLKNPSSSSFYNKEYTFKINVKLNKNNLSSFKVNNELYKFTNKATSTITRNGTSSKTSNTVTTNYYVKNLTITKNWKDNNNAYNSRPSSISYTLKRDGTNYKTGTITSSGNWQITINDLPRYKADGTEYSYTVTENTVSAINGDAYVASYNGLTITNTLSGNKNIIITKIWEDENNIYGTRPSSLKITILQNGINYKDIMLNSSNAMSGNSNSWRTSVSVPKYDSNGVEYIYTIKEDTSNTSIKYFYETPIYNQSTLTVTNKAQFIPTYVNGLPTSYKIIIKKEIINENNVIANEEDFNEVALNINDKYNFVITLKELNKTVTNTGTKLQESYSGYSGKEITGILTNKGDLVIDLGENGSGKYEISENMNQYFDFVDIEKLNDEFNTSGASFSKENGKYYITISGLTGSYEQISVKVTNQIKPDRPYNETEDKNNMFKM